MLITVLLATIGLLALWGLARLLWAWMHIRYHPHVELVGVALPDLAPTLTQLVAQISFHANITPPDLLIRRGRLPNAFVIASILRTELYLTDELLEHANDRADGVDYFIKVLCHEIAHLKNNDALPFGIIIWIESFANKMHWTRLTNRCEKRLMIIEEKANAMAEVLQCQLMNTKGKKE